MAKTVSSAGLADFVETGTPTLVYGKDGKPVAETKSTPAASEQPKAEPSAIGASPPEAKTEPVKEPDELTDEEKALPEKAQKEIQRAKRAVNEKHRQMKEAQEAAEEAERFAEQQYNERRLAEQARDAAEAKAKDLESKTKPPEPENKEPDENDPKYKDAQGQFLWKQFSKDQAEYAADQKLNAYKETLAKAAREAETQAKVARIQASATEARKALPDFDEVMAKVKDSENDVVPQFMIRYIEDSDRSAFVAYHLAKNPEESQRIAKLSPVRGIHELGKIEDSWVKPPSQTTIVPVVEGATAVKSGGTPPPPITPLSGEGTAGTQTDPAKMNFRQLREYERERNKKR